MPFLCCSGWILRLKKKISCKQCEILEDAHLMWLIYKVFYNRFLTVGFYPLSVTLKASFVFSCIIRIVNL